MKLSFRWVVGWSLSILANGLHTLGRFTNKIRAAFIIDALKSVNALFAKMVFFLQSRYTLLLLKLSHFEFRSQTYVFLAVVTIRVIWVFNVWPTSHFYSKNLYQLRIRWETISLQRRRAAFLFGRYESSQTQDTFVKGIWFRDPDSQAKFFFAFVIFFLFSVECDR